MRKYPYQNNHSRPKWTLNSYLPIFWSLINDMIRVSAYILVSDWWHIRVCSYLWPFCGWGLSSAHAAHHRYAPLPIILTFPLGHQRIRMQLILKRTQKLLEHHHKAWVFLKVREYIQWQNWSLPCLLKVWSKPLILFHFISLFFWCVFPNRLPYPWWRAVVIIP